MENILTINHIDDEHKEFYLNDDFIISVNHDSDGWTGMEKVERALTIYQIN